jgi:hypothetical protein
MICIQMKKHLIINKAISNLFVNYWKIENWLDNLLT